MISAIDLRSIARARLRDAQILLQAKRFDGAFYLCGHAVEVALKARICRTLEWNPEKRYQPIGKSTQQQATDMVMPAKRLLEVL